MKLGMNKIRKEEKKSKVYKKQWGCEVSLLSGVVFVVVVGFLGDFVPRAANSSTVSVV